ncbi:hypothetical protein B0H19DRAFT_1078060 [Mycena capillaripes]|nr:hypothetical protein B0H19DRAFT_1078060 [Mycena capillaripes]
MKVFTFIKKIKSLAPLLPDSVAEASEDDNELHRVLTDTCDIDDSSWGTLNRQLDKLFGADTRENGRFKYIRRELKLQRIVDELEYLCAKGAEVKAAKSKQPIKKRPNPVVEKAADAANDVLIRTLSRLLMEKFDIQFAPANSQIFSWSFPRITCFSAFTARATEVSTLPTKDTARTRVGTFSVKTFAARMSFALLASAARYPSYGTLQMTSSSGVLNVVIKNTFSSVNLFDEHVMSDLANLIIETLQANDTDIHVVVFSSGNKGFFLDHFDVNYFFPGYVSPLPIFDGGIPTMLFPVAILWNITQLPQATIAVMEGVSIFSGSKGTTGFQMTPTAPTHRKTRFHGIVVGVETFWVYKQTAVRAVARHGGDFFRSIRNIISVYFHNLLGVDVNEVVGSLE